MFENPRTSTLALTKTDDGRYKAWLRLPVTAAQAQLAGITAYPVKENIGTFRCATLLGYANAIGVEHSQWQFRYLDSKDIAMNTIAALDALCADKRLRQRARICAWLVGADLGRIFGRACALLADETRHVDIIACPSSGKTIHVDARRGAELARTIRNGELGIKRIGRIESRIEQMLWCAMKAADTKRADYLGHMGREYDRLTWLFADTYDRHMRATRGEDPNVPAGNDFAFAHSVITDELMHARGKAYITGLDGRETMSLCELVAAAATIYVTA